MFTDTASEANANYLRNIADQFNWPAARIFRLAALLDEAGTAHDATHHARLIERAIRAHPGDALAVGLDILRCAPYAVVSRRGTDGRGLRVTLPTYANIKPREDEYGPYVAKWLGFAGIDPTTPLLWRHDPAERSIGRVLGVRDQPSGDVDVWIEVVATRLDLIERAIYGELSASPRVVSIEADGAVMRDRFTGERTLQYGRGYIRELSLTDAGANALPVSVSLDACPASVRTETAENHRQRAIEAALRAAEDGDASAARRLGLITTRAAAG